MPNVSTDHPKDQLWYHPASQKYLSGTGFSDASPEVELAIKCNNRREEQYEQIFETN